MYFIFGTWLCFFSMNKGFEETVGLHILHKTYCISSRAPVEESRHSDHRQHCQILLENVNKSQWKELHPARKLRKIIGNPHSLSINLLDALHLDVWGDGLLKLASKLQDLFCHFFLWFIECYLQWFGELSSPSSSYIVDVTWQITLTFMSVN